MQTVLQRVFEIIGTAWDWFARLFTSMFGLLLTVGMVVAVFEASPFFAITVPFCLYLIATPIIPDRTKAVLQWIGRQFTKPYDRLLLPYVVEPIEKVGEAVGEKLWRIIIVVIWVAVAIVVIVAGTFAGWFALKMVAAIPVSIAIIIGALIIANALRPR